MKQFSFFLRLIVTFLTSSARLRRALFIGGLLLAFVSSNASEAFYNPIVAAISGINRICVGSTATLSDATSGGVWKSYNTGIATIDQNGLVTGITMGSVSIGYTVTAIDNTSTTVFYSLTITSPTLFNCEVGYDSLHFTGLPNCDTTICEGTKLWLSVNPNGITPITTWTGPNGFSASSINSNNDVLITNNVTPATAGIYTITYTIPGCVSTKSINIHTKSVTQVAPVNGTTSVCAGSTTTLSDSTIGGIWSTSNNAIATVSSAGIVTGVAGGTATISYTYTNVNACSVAQTALVTVSTPVVLTCEGGIGPQYSIGGLTNCTINACLGQNLWLSVNPNNLPGGSATWTGPNGFSSASLNTGNDILVTNSLTAAQGGVYTATYTYGVCTSVANITVVANAVPVVAPITGNNNICMGGGTTQLSDSTPGGVWKSTNTGYATITSSGLVTGILSANIYMDYTVTNTAGCSTVQQFLVSINSPFVFTCEGSIDNHAYSSLPNCTYTVCSGSPVWLSVNPNFSSTPGGDWTGPNGFSSPSLNGNNDVLITSAATLSQAGDYTITYHGVCTSVATITLVVNPTPVLDTIAGYSTVCKGGMIQLTNTTPGGAWTSSNTNTVTINSGGIASGIVNGNSNITYTVNNASGCSAKVSKLITVTTSTQTNPLVSGPGSICVGSSANLSTTVQNGVWSSSNTALATINNTGTVSVIAPGYVYIMYNLTNTNGCNFTAFKTINTPTKSTSTTTANICAGSSYTFNGTSYNTSGTYTAHFTNSVGCDSAATLVLMVKLNTTSTTNASICAGTNYTFNGISYNTTGIYTYHTINAVGCDSAATLVLTVKASSTSTTNASICSGSNYTFNGTAYNTAGTYTYHTTNAVGCDSTATLNLTINNPSTSTTTITSCNAYTWNGTTYTTSGTYTYSTTNAAGCDSIATLILTINNGSTSTTNATICAGSSYTFNGQVYNAAGTYLAFLTNNAGCDSVATLNLIVNQPTSSTTYASICNGSAYSFNGQNYNTTGTYLSFLTNSVGCDSVATLVLTVNMPTTSTTNVTACSTYTWNATTYTTSGTYTYNTTNSKGCDSIATLNLIISNGTSSTTNISICNGSSYSFNGQTYNSTGTYLAFLTNSAGCDSVATLNLKINQTTTSVTNITNCNSYTWNGTVYTTSGTYTFHTNNAVGCDSIATLNLIINKGTSSTTNVSICNGSSYTFNGHTYSSQGTYTATLTNSVGCDSTATLNLTVTNVGQPTVQPISGISSVCPGDSTILTDLTPGGIWSIDSTSIATIDSITGLVKGLVQGAAIVSYTVGSVGSDCSATVSVPLTINCNEVASGSTGGLESKGLGNAVAKRVYNAALSNTDNRIDYSRLTPVKTNNIIQVMGTTTPGTLTLSDLMPAKESIGCGYKSYDMSSHVTDLTGFTNAEAVQTFDYVAKNETQSVTFLTRTYGNIYAHTKPVCDRLKEAKLLDVKQVVVQGMTFIQYKLQQNDGKIEYAISFSAGVKQNDSKFTIQSIWLTKNYTIQDTMYNFQVWAVEPAMAKNMVNNILTKLNGILPVNQTVDSIGIPTTYITDITRTQNKLILNVRNNTNATNGAINLTVRSNENMTTTSPMIVPVTLLPKAITPVSIDVNDSYESDISLLVDNNVKDMVYMNDGNWNYSVSKTSIVPNKFTISNDGIMPTADEYRLFRNVTIDVNVPDYVSIYKMMKAGGLTRDVSKYNQLQFKASALNTGKLTIVIQKAAITNWSEQYTYTLPINGDLKDYAVNLKDFRSTSSNDTLKADDIVTITFSFIGSGNNNHIIASLADVKFSQKTITQPVVNAKTMNVFPNPATDKFSVRFESAINTQLKLQLVEMGTGRIILNKDVNVVAGENLIPVSINTTINTDGHYVLLLGNETIKYSPFKLVLRK